MNGRSRVMISQMRISPALSAEPAPMDIPFSLASLYHIPFDHPVFCIVPLMVLIFQECIAVVCLFVKAWFLKHGSWRHLGVSRFPTQKPVCPACQEAKGETPSAKPPSVIEHHRGQPGYVDTSNHYCPDPECSYYGWVGYGNSGRWRQSMKMVA